jgi:hypothetical protein
MDIRIGEIDFLKLFFFGEHDNFFKILVVYDNQSDQIHLGFSNQLSWHSNPGKMLQCNTSSEFWLNSAMRNRFEIPIEYAR